MLICSVGQLQAKMEFPCKAVRLCPTAAKDKRMVQSPSESIARGLGTWALGVQVQHSILPLPQTPMIFLLGKVDKCG